MPSGCHLTLATTAYVFMKFNVSNPIHSLEPAGRKLLPISEHQQIDPLPPLVPTPRKKKAEFRNVRVDLGQYDGKEVPFLGCTHASGYEGRKRKGVC